MYGQAASVIQFLKEGPHKRKFAEFLHAMGKVPRSDLRAIEKVLRSVYGLSIEEFSAEWEEYYAG